MQPLVAFWSLASSFYSTQSSIQLYHLQKHNSSLNQSLIFTMFHLLVTFPERITLLLFVNKPLRGKLSFVRRLRNFFTPLQLFALYRVVSPLFRILLAHLGPSHSDVSSWKIKSRVFKSTIFLSLTFSSFFLPVELLCYSLFYQFYIWRCCSGLSSYILLHCVGFMRHTFYTISFFLSNSLTPGSTALLICILLVNSGTHSLYLFPQLPSTCVLLKAMCWSTLSLIIPLAIFHAELGWVSLVLFSALE